MSKPCPECRSMMNPEAPHCDACGCPFPPAPAPQMAIDLKAFIGALVVFAVFVVAFAFLRSFAG